jgi:ATP-dependent DNA helicase RecG
MTDQVTPYVTQQVARVLGATRWDCSFGGLRTSAGLKDRANFPKTRMEPLLPAGWIERIPDKPRSSKQKYRLTEQGRQALRELAGGG